MIKRLLLILLTTTVILAGCATHMPTVFRPRWSDCRHASLWDGANAEKRMMNILSPHFSESKVKDYIRWQKKTRGADHTHIILANHADGEGAAGAPHGYSIYGDPVTWEIDQDQVKRMLSRVKHCRREGLGVVLWLLTDDSTTMNRTLLGDPERYLRDLAKTGVFNYASAVCLGLELDEWANDAQVAALAAATRKHYKGKIATHHRSRRTDFVHHGDLLFYQLSPGASASTIAAETARALKHGKPVAFFELARNPNRELCQVALDNGAYSVANW